MSKVKFISVKYLKENTTIEDNVDDNKLTPFIYKSQDIHIQQALGSAFYTHLKDAIINNSLTSDEEILLRDYIQPCLSEFVLYEAMPFLNFKMTNKAVSQENSEFSTSSTLDDIKYLRQSVRDLAEFYLERLIKHLCDYTSLFPIYQNPGAKENLEKNNKSYFNGMYIPRKGNNTDIRSYNDPSDDCDDC